MISIRGMDREETEARTVPAGPLESPDGRSLMPRLVGGGVLVLIGVLWLLARTETIDLNITAVLALGTMVVGVALMVLSRRGSHGGLITFGIILALITLATAAAPLGGFQGGIGDRDIDVSSVDDIRPDYNLAMGNLTIDLRGIDELGVATQVIASVGMGELVIRIPEGTEVSVEGRVGAGELEILGTMFDGIGIDETHRSPGFEGSSQSLALQLEVFLGRVEVIDG